VEANFLCLNPHSAAGKQKKASKPYECGKKKKKKKSAAKRNGSKKKKKTTKKNTRASKGKVWGGRLRL